MIDYFRRRFLFKRLLRLWKWPLDLSTQGTYIPICWLQWQIYLGSLLVTWPTIISEKKNHLTHFFPHTWSNQFLFLSLSPSQTANPTRTALFSLSDRDLQATCRWVCHFSRSILFDFVLFDLLGFCLTSMYPFCLILFCSILFCSISLGFCSTTIYPFCLILFCSISLGFCSTSIYPLCLILFCLISLGFFSTSIYPFCLILLGFCSTYYGICKLFCLILLGFSSGGSRRHRDSERQGRRTSIFRYSSNSTFLTFA